jgi:hypothetical protein
LLLGLVIAVLAPVAAFARSDGIARNGNGCGGCHGNNQTGSLNVSISGSATLAPNEVATYTLTIDSVLAGGAFSLSASDGTVSAVDANTQAMGTNIVHLDALSAAPTGNIDDWSYDFAYMAPAVNGTYTISFSGMAFNGDRDNSNADIWNTGSFTITVVPEPGTALLVSMGLGMLALAGNRRRRG